MRKERDLRAEKTDRAIRGAFLELLLKELAERAEINKGTFYLHYRDLYDLYRRLVEETAGKIADSFDPYPDLFRAPEAFVDTFFFQQAGAMGESLTAGERALLSGRNIRFAAEYPRCFLEAFKARHYRAAPLPASEENDHRLEFLLTGMLSVLIRCRSDAWDGERRARFTARMAGVIRELFPEFCRGS